MTGGLRVKSKVLTTSAAKCGGVHPDTKNGLSHPSTQDYFSVVGWEEA
jgi:hypothetical protein